MSDPTSDLIARRERAFGRDAQLFYEQPMQLVRGEGVWLFDAEGARFLDLYNNVPCVGHANPRVVEAIARQARTLNVHSRYVHEGVIEYVERLVGLHHDALESLVMACSGTEASEIALMMAREATGKAGIVCTDAAYHGNSAEVAKLTRLPVGGSRPGVRSIPTPQRFRPVEQGLSDAELCDRYVDHLEQAIASLESDGTGFAGLMICSILANEGLAEPPRGFFRRAVDVVHAAGGLVIADEVQSGFCRSGRWWGYETNAFAPDIVTMGKPMGNGFPVSAVAASHDLVTGFRRRFRYFNTFAASPLQAAAGGAVLDEIDNHDLMVQVRQVGEELRAGLRELQSRDPRMGDVRGRGLFIGIDWVAPGSTEPDVAGAAAMVEELKRRQMLLGKAGQHGNVLKIRPPLVFTSDHARLFLDAFAAALTDVGG